MLSLLNNNARVLLGCALLVAVLYAPPVVVAAIALALSLRWRAWEVIVAGVFMDFLWSPAVLSLTSWDTIPLATPIAIALVFGFEPLRRQLLLGKD